MAQVRVGYSCADGHFSPAFDLWEPVRQRDIDRQAERRALPTECVECAAALSGRLHVEDQDPMDDSIPYSTLSRRTKKRPKEGPLTPAEWKRQAFERQRPERGKPALCAVTGKPLDFALDHSHHPLEKSILRQRGLYDKVWDVRNSVCVKNYVHGGHTSRMAPIPREALHPDTWEFARELGRWAVQRIEDDHPPAATLKHAS